MEVGSWVYKNFDEICGITFLPYVGHTYKQAPYQECNKEEYTELLKKIPKSIDWDKLQQYEQTDMTNAAQNLACVGPNAPCEL
jgi:hypothetical protein